MKNDRFIIITGLSGSGKTVVSRFLEDFGYYCIDNLPTKLIPKLVDLWSRREVEIDKISLVVDIRESNFSYEFPKVLEKINKKIDPTLIFLEASDETLIKRFSESRRPHPIMNSKSVTEAVKLERKKLENIKKFSDDVIDTTSTNVLQLRELLMNRFPKKKSKKMRIAIVSFGYKYGIPLDSDLVFDARFLPNPFYVERLRKKTGKNIDVKKYVLKSPETKKFLGKIFDFINYFIPNFHKEGKSYITISIGCTGGKHRSVFLAEEVKKDLKCENYQVRIHHRDIYK
ncbi:MAG: RNase adapter RapZ [Candidatus Aminicenantaceae bacterium]